jgi:AraC-like DNA-binding protein
VSPKKFAGLARLGKAVHLRAAGANSAAAAHAAGYYDQSHFLRDFRRATGSTPDAFFRRNGAAPDAAQNAESVQYAAARAR